MLSGWLAAVLLQVPAPTAAVIDVSAPDAVYEDVSRAMADEVVRALTKAGLQARRVEEGELPEAGCKEGPCLGQVAREQHADVLVTLDAVDLEATGVGVAVTALKGRTGEPVAGGRYVVASKARRPPKELLAFVKKVAEAMVQKPAPPDAGAAPAVPAAAQKKRSL